MRGRWRQGRVYFRALIPFRWNRSLSLPARTASRAPTSGHAPPTDRYGASSRTRWLGTRHAASRERRPPHPRINQAYCDLAGTVTRPGSTRPRRYLAWRSDFGHGVLLLPPRPAQLGGAARRAAGRTLVLHGPVRGGDDRPRPDTRRRRRHAH